MKGNGMSKREMISQKKEKKTKKKKRFLVSVNVLGSAGPLRFLVDEEDEVSVVIDTALRAYAREDRFPVLGLHARNFLLYSASSGFNALIPQEKIGSVEGRDFLLCKKEQLSSENEGRGETRARRGHGWKAWLLKPFKLHDLITSIKP
ncbi:PREDICTED: uncharacterized protein LOC104805613 [Tarenaya hassleriana]|uniref:uncharacterized protein LOC104805613 n=1 Tax=Tarenaya hassleriana TaxID=28532 RepID=UPI00053C1704|nr:PREDICTED: uncharacterized protein LOC104805613 [Tarenaya hassleriana]